MICKEKMPDTPPTYNFQLLISEYDLELCFNVKNFACQFIKKAIKKATRIISDMVCYNKFLYIILLNELFKNSILFIGRYF